MRTINSFIAAQALALVASSSVSAQQHPGEVRARELAALVTSGDRPAAEGYVREHFSPGMQELPMEMHLEFIAELRDHTRGLSFDGVQSSTGNTIVARYRSHLTGDYTALLIRVEAASPHRIAGLGLRPAVPPQGTPRHRRLSDAELADALKKYLDTLGEADLFSGAVLVAHDGRPIFQAAYGEANKEFGVPNRIDTRFNLGSMNKMFTALAIALLVERGQLSFQDPLSKFLPDFPNKEAAAKIRIEHLLTHTSGLGSYFTGEFREASRARFRTVDEMMWLARNDSMAFEPGTRWSYSNTGMLVLGKVIEVVSGQDYFEYVRRNIFEPAGMMSTDSYELDLVTPNLAVGYQKEYKDSGIRFRNNLFSHVIRGGPAGGGYSTVEDLLRFARALQSHRLVGEEFTRLLLSPKPELGSPGYGYGFAVDQQAGVAGHSGGFAGISANLDMFMREGYTVIVLSNYGGAAPNVVTRIREWLAPHH